MKLYYFAPSGPCRGALLAARALGINLTVETLDLWNKEHLKESFVKINPQHCVPTLDDNGFILWESKAIACYLSDKYGKDDKLYPKDLHQRALIDQLLFFDASNLYVKIRAICRPILFQGVKTIQEVDRNLLNEALGHLDKSLESNKWLVGDHYTVADTCIYASISGILHFGWDMSPFSNIQNWINACAILPGYEENEEGAKLFAQALKSKLSS